MATRYAIVLYTYNQEDCVRSAARAVLGQNCEPLDILFSDDCSADRTFEILAEEAARYTGPHRVSLNRNSKNLGVIQHVQRVFEICDADLMINCAGDDISHHNRAQRVIKLYENEAPLLIFSRAKVETLDGHPEAERYLSATFYQRRDAKAAATSMQLYLGATCAWHRDLLTFYGPVTENILFEDLIYGYRAALEGRVGFLDEALVTYRVGAGVTNAPKAPETLAQVRARRAREIEQESAVLRQRILDTLQSGKDPGGTLMRRLSKALRQRRTRLAVINDQTSVLRAAAWRHPLETLAIIGSERRKWRRQARQD